MGKRGKIGGKSGKLWKKGIILTFEALKYFAYELNESFQCDASIFSKLSLQKKDGRINTVKYIGDKCITFNLF